ncbi:glycosyltransferase [Flavobacterium sp. NG2]|uniref:glycosyltransferase n=1 Tax=Flavobacterium sp. NG2 TaxID=3097547 RepID=UPI002A80784E|nr:glycosyltransferase [Flavobacterium sp. NG2]WPR70202.1 glycosyltransferase [Flavobacterium sp. NG2]
MKILYIVPDITDSGGIARVISLKTNYLVENLNYQVSLLSVTNTYPNVFYDFNQKTKWYTIAPSNNKILFLIKYIRYINKTIVIDKPDVIVVCDAVLWLFVPWFLKTKIPLIFETHFSIRFQKKGYTSLYRRIRNKLIVSWRKKTINLFKVAVFETIQGSKEWGVENSKVIANPASFLVNEQASLINKKAMAVCMNPYVKGLDRLFTIWKKIILKHPDWILDVYGHWTTNIEYINKAKLLKIEQNINFLPPTTAIYDSYLQASVFLMTSRYEAFGMVLIESMAVGLPCVAYDCPCGPGAVIDDGINGFLIEDGNVDDYVEKVLNIIEDEDLRIKIGIDAKKSVHKYTIEVIMQEWEKLFVNVVND